MTSETAACGGIDPADAVLRGARRAEGGARVALLRLVAARAVVWRADLLAEERSTGTLFPVALRYTDEQVDALVVDEMATLLGLSRWAAVRLVEDARVLTTVMPEVLVALEDGRLDCDRVTALVRATEDLPDPAAARVAETVLAGDQRWVADLGVKDPGVWDLASYSSWRGRVTRAVAKEHAMLPEDERPTAPTPSVSVRIFDALHADLTFSGTAEDVTWLHQALQDHADQAVPPGAVGPDGRLLRQGERDAAALVGIFATGELPTAASGSGRRREVGIVLHADTFFGDGPAVDDPGQLRGAGTPIAVPAAEVRSMATAALDRGAGTSLLLADDAGRLVRLVRVGAAPAGGWTRPTLLGAGRTALARLASLETTAHDPTVAIDEHVRAAHPTSTGPGTGCATHSGSRRVDLDHRIPHPRGPTTPANLQPLHRTPHRHKTRGYWHCHPDDDTVTWTTSRGATWTYRPDPLPGHAHGEAWAGVPRHRS